MIGAKHTYHQGGDKGEFHPTFAFFNVAESNEKLLVRLSDILLVETDEYDTRNKTTYIKNEHRVYTLMNVPFSTLYDYKSNLIMINKRTLVSAEAIHTHIHDTITLKNIFPDWKNKQVILSRKYKEDFYVRFESITKILLAQENSI